MSNELFLWGFAVAKILFFYWVFFKDVPARKIDRYECLQAISFIEWKSATQIKIELERLNQRSINTTEVKNGLKLLVAEDLIECSAFGAGPVRTHCYRRKSGGQDTQTFFNPPVTEPDMHCV